MLVNFQVTDKIIDESRGGCSKRCVVANMVNEVLRFPYCVGVCAASVNVYREENFMGKPVKRLEGCVSNPPEVEQFIIHFDAYKSQVTKKRIRIYHPTGVFKFPCCCSLN